MDDQNSSLVTDEAIEAACSVLYFNWPKMDEDGKTSTRFAMRMVLESFAHNALPSSEHGTPVGEIVAASTPAAELLYGRDVKFYEAMRSLPIGTKLYGSREPPSEHLLSADQLCRTPLIEWLVPTAEEWSACEVMQDRYDLMKRRVQMAFTDASLSPEGH